MAFQNWKTSAENITVRAATDLTGYQHRLVVVASGGVLACDGAATVTSWGRPYVLTNAPASGEECSLMGSPNVAKVYAREAPAIGQTVTATVSGQVAVSSYGIEVLSGDGVFGNILLGQVFQGTTTSGAVVSVRLF